MSVVKAKDLVPQAFKPAAADLTDREDDLDYDLGHLAAFDAHQVEIKVRGRAWPALCGVRCRACGKNVREVTENGERR